AIADLQQNKVFVGLNVSCDVNANPPPTEYVWKLKSFSKEYSDNDADAGPGLGTTGRDAGSSSSGSGDAEAGLLQNWTGQSGAILIQKSVDDDEDADEEED